MFVGGAPPPARRNNTALGSSAGAATSEPSGWRPKPGKAASGTAPWEPATIQSRIVLSGRVAALGVNTGMREKSPSTL